ncbi:MAG: hypothetical protein ABI873_20090 [Marmoricola sp.]
MGTRLVGASPGLTLFDDAARRVAFVSVWRVDWSARGSGRALVLWMGGRARVVTEKPELGLWLASEFVRHFPEMHGVVWPEPEVTTAPVSWEIDLATGFHAEADDERVEITDPMDHRVVTTDDFALGELVSRFSTVYVPCRSGRLTIGGEAVVGLPRVSTNPRATSSAFLAEAEVWSDTSG